MGESIPARTASDGKLSEPRPPGTPPKKWKDRCTKRNSKMHPNISGGKRRKIR